MYTDRPKIKIEKTVGHKFFDWFAGIIFIGVIGYWIFNFSSLPAEVPMHYNFNGEITRYGSKWEMIILPIISVFLWLLCYAIEKNPQYMNVPKKFNAENAEAIYRNGVYMGSVIKNIMLLIFSFLIVEIMWTANGNPSFLNGWFFAVIIGATIIPIIYYGVKQFKIR